MIKSKFNIPIAKVDLTENDINSVLKPLSNGWLVQGPMVSNFENIWSDFVGVKHSIAVTSCTSAMMLALIALGFKKGDEVIVPALTWISTANVVEQLGGKVIFCDIDINTFNIDINKIESLITPKTKYIMPVHLFGLPADIKKINKIAKQHNLKVIEDAACGFGSKINNVHVGATGNIACFSFHPRKSITTGEGGMIVTNNDRLAEKLRILRDHGAKKSDLQRHLGSKPFLLSDHVLPGYNQRMTDIQASLGFSQMKRAKIILKERIKIAKNYHKNLSEIDCLKLPIPKENYFHSFQSYPCLIRLKDHKSSSIKKTNKRRNIIMEKLQDVGISTRPATHAVHMLSFYKKKYKLKPSDFLNSWIVNDCSMSLPLYNGMTLEEQSYVINKIKHYFKTL